MKTRRCLFLLALAALPLLVYLPNLGQELIWDSKAVIGENELLQDEFSPLAPFRTGYWAATSQRTSRYDYYRPLTTLSFMVEKAVWGLSPWRLRFVNLLIFIAALFALYAFLLRQNAPPGVAETAVLLFALFPLHVDNICWIVSRGDLLLLLFGVLSLLQFDRFLDERRPLPGLLASAFFALALFSKEAALFLLPLFPLHQWLRRRRFSPLLYILPLALSAAFWLLKSAAIGRHGFPIRPFPGLWENVTQALGALGYYARALVFPFHYSSFLPLDVVQTPYYLAAGGVFLIVLALTPLWSRRGSGFAGAWFWTAPFAAGSLLLVFTPIHPFSIFSRYMLIPAIGWTWLLAHGLHALRPLARKAVLAALLVASAAAVIVQAQRFRSELAFWEDAFRSCPDNSFILDKYAGQLKENGNYAGSEVLLQRALSFKMKSTTAASIALQLSAIAFTRARYEESREWLARMDALNLDPLQAQHRHHRLLQIRLAAGDLAGAEAALGQAAEAAREPQATRQRIEIYLAFTAWDKAHASAASLPAPLALEWSKRIRAEEGVFRSLGPRRQAEYFIERGNFGCAWTLWPDKDAPGIPEQLQAARLAILAGHEEEGMGRIERLRREHKGDFKVLNSLGTLFLEMQRLDEALASYRRSLHAKPDQPALRERIALLDPLRR